jgi:hypothetical protein
MSLVKSISIHKPCHEQWDQMVEVADGRYCMNCRKTVADFTVMSNADVIAFLGSNGNVCGRFNKTQLQQINREIGRGTNYSSLWRKTLAAASFMGLIPFVRAEAKYKTPIEQLSTTVCKNKPAKAIDTTGWIVLKGHVTAKDDTLPIPGANIQLNDKTLGTSTGINGDFKLIVPSSADSLIVSFIGYKTQRFKIGETPNKFYKVVMEADPAFANQVDVVAGGISVRYSFTHRLWRKIKRIF